MFANGLVVVAIGIVVCVVWGVGAVPCLSVWPGPELGKALQKNLAESTVSSPSLSRKRPRQ